MYITDMHRGCGSQFTVCLCPWSARLIGSQTLTRVLRHRIDIGIERQRFREHEWSVGIMGTQDDRWDILSAGCFQSVFDTRDDGVVHPLDIILYRRHRLTQGDQHAHIRIFLEESSNALTGIVGDQRGDRSVTLLCLQSVVVGKRLRQDNVIEHLDNLDATTGSLSGEEGEHLHVLLHGSLIHLSGEGIVLQLNE